MPALYKTMVIVERRSCIIQGPVARITPTMANSFTYTTFCVLAVARRKMIMPSTVLDSEEMRIERRRKPRLLDFSGFIRLEMKERERKRRWRYAYWFAFRVW
ncbi:hypothetical protein HS088_TW22G01129 [Tripterygium wilfordii]|uniref:Uncharacterized protein n=1 Tax=Tripterygium wilfordii TaxID=458696 RepID=A0A7J7C0Y4_TRIWF|nr:hypothetical protein HS088_TW22G01129 [Tripterygium wilfordii]